MSTGNVGGTGSTGSAPPSPLGSGAGGPPPTRSFDSVVRRPVARDDSAKTRDDETKKKDEAGSKTTGKKQPKTLEEYRAMRAEEGGGGKGDSEDLGERGVPNPISQKPLGVRSPVESKASTRVAGAGISKETIDRIVEKVRIGVNRAGATEMHFDLKDNVLGGLSIKVSMIDGKVYATFIADSPGVKEMLDENSDRLEKALRDRGLAIGQLKVDLRHGDVPERDPRHEATEEGWDEAEDDG